LIFFKPLPPSINTARTFFRFRFLARIRIYLQNAISTANQGPKREKISTKNRGQKSRVRVPLIVTIKGQSHDNCLLDSTGDYLKITWSLNKNGYRY